MMSPARAMALFGLVWLLRMRGGECGCAACRRERRAAAQHPQQQQPQQPLGDNDSPVPAQAVIKTVVESDAERTTHHIAEVCTVAVDCDAPNDGAKSVDDGDDYDDEVPIVTCDATVQTDFDDDDCYAYDASAMPSTSVYESSDTTKIASKTTIVHAGDPEDEEDSSSYYNPCDEYEWQFFEVQLERGAAGLGFSIAGGTDGARRGDASIYITKLTDAGAATLDGRLRLNDAILQVNGVSVVGVPHATAVEALKRAGNLVTLYVRRAHPGRRAILARLEKGARGLGFSIAGGRGSPHIPGDDGIFITQISAGGAAAVCEKLHVGDRIVAVNNTSLGDRSLVGVTHAEAVAALKAAGDVVDLLVVPAIRSQSESLCGRQRSQGTSCSALHELTPYDQDIPRTVRTVLLRRSGSRLGMDIVGGEGGGWGVFVSGAAAGGAAAGHLYRGDQILAVDGIDLTTASHEQAARALKGTGSLVTIKAQYKPEEYRCLEAKIRELNMQILRDRIASGGELTKSEENLFYMR